MAAILLNSNYLTLLNADRCPVNFFFILVVFTNIIHQKIYYRNPSKVMSTGCRTIILTSTVALGIPNAKAENCVALPGAEALAGVVLPWNTKSPN